MTYICLRSFFCILVGIIRQPSSVMFCRLLYNFFFLVFFVFTVFCDLAYWVKDVNNFLSCELKKMSFIGEYYYLCIELSLSVYITIED
jgi:hypothetical protein